jgi:hypothetical protein
MRDQNDHACSGHKGNNIAKQSCQWTESDYFIIKGISSCEQLSECVKEIQFIKTQEKPDQNAYRCKRNQFSVMFTNECVCLFLSENISQKEKREKYNGSGQI